MTGEDNNKATMIFMVKTKTEDGGTPAPKDNDGSDAFSLYSNMSVRMIHRRLIGLDNAGETSEGPGTTTNEARKTRLSTEVYPDSILNEMMMIDEHQE